MEQLFAEASEKALRDELDVPSLFQAAGSLMSSENISHAIDLYRIWIGVNPGSPFLCAIYFNLGIALQRIQDIQGAAEVYSEAIRLTPSFAPPYINLSRVYEVLGRSDQAIETLRALLHELSSVSEDSINNKSLALKQLARLLDIRRRDSHVEYTLKQNLAINPHQREIIQHFVNTRMFLCDWPPVIPTGRLSKPDIIKSMAPLSVACYTDDPLLQLSTAYYYNKYDVKCPEPIGIAGSWLPPGPHRPDKLRIGYVSSDLHGHAVGYLVTEAFELHDRNSVEVYIYYWGPKISEAMNLRIVAAADKWRNIHVLSDKEAASLIVEDGIDILVDLNGHTSDTRTSIFTYRPAPIIVNWLGFPGTMGSHHHAYIIADDYIIPKSHERYYSEKVMRLPCYQPNDRKRIISSSPPSRKDANLPEGAFVYCCFNGVQKINHFTFGRWMTILRHVPSSFLWLLDGGAEANAALLNRAVQHQIHPDRIIFAPKIANHDHLARYPLADLFLDTAPYGAHTTASDALWMGVPILTMPGRSFASRVCASLVHAAGMDELICQDSETYVARAIELGHNIDIIRAYKEKISRNRETCILFNTNLLVESLEKLYYEMWSDYQGQYIPRPTLRNVQVYNDIGTTIDHDAIELQGQPDYDGLYETVIESRRNYIDFED